MAGYETRLKQQKQHEQLTRSATESGLTTTTSIQRAGLDCRGCDTFQPKSHRHLVVDDSDDNRLILATYLETFGITCDQATDGLEALKLCTKIRAKNNEYDAIWMDLRMPHMDGYECSEKLRQDVGFQNVIIVAVTGDIHEDNVYRCIDIGINDIIMKPVFLHQLQQHPLIKKIYDVIDSPHVLFLRPDVQKGRVVFFCGQPVQECGSCIFIFHWCSCGRQCGGR